MSQSEAILEIELHRTFAAASGDFPTVLREGTVLQRIPDSKPIESVHGIRKQRLANMKSGKLLALDDDHLPTLLREQNCRRATGRTTSNDCDIKLGTHAGAASLRITRIMQCGTAI